MQDVAPTVAADVKLRKLMLAFVHLILDELRGTALTLDPEALSPPLLAQGDRQARPVRPRHARDHPTGMDQGLFATGDPKMIEFAMMGAVNWITQMVRPRRPDDVRADRRRFCGLPRRPSQGTGPERLGSGGDVPDGSLGSLSRFELQDVDAAPGEVLLQLRRGTGEQRERAPVHRYYLPDAEPPCGHRGRVRAPS